MPLTPAATAQADRCVHCPRMCQAACPVGRETAREDRTPWGMMTQLGGAVPPTREPMAGVADVLPGFLRGSLKLPTLVGEWAGRAARLVDGSAGRELDADTAESFYACTGCLRCRPLCEHGNDVPSALWEGRAAAVEAGVAPAAASVVHERFARHGHAHDADLGRALENLARELPSPVRPDAPRFLPGCEAVSSSPAAVRATVSAAAKLGEPLSLLRDVTCCGAPLLDAGFRDAFAAHVGRVWERLGSRKVVTSSPHCARALTEGARSVGVAPRGEVVHASVHLARRLASARREFSLRAAPLRRSVAFHDPCELGRGLGQYDAPRELLAAAGVELREPAATRERSDCCGAGGLLPRTFPDTARAMALARADALRVLQADSVATACPGCRRSLESGGLDVVDVVEVLDEWLSGAGPAGAGGEGESG